MQSNNPVFRRSEEFNRSGANAYGNQTYAGNGNTYAGYGDPAQWGTGTPTQAPGSTRRMTIDSSRTFIYIRIPLISLTSYPHCFHPLLSSFLLPLCK